MIPDDIRGLPREVWDIADEWTGLRQDQARERLACQIHDYAKEFAAGHVAVAHAERAAARAELNEANRERDELRCRIGAEIETCKSALNHAEKREDDLREARDKLQKEVNDWMSRANSAETAMRMSTDGARDRLADLQQRIQRQDQEIAWLRLCIDRKNSDA